MVQNPKYWRAKECARLQNKTQLRLPFTLSGVFSFQYVTPLIRIGQPQTYTSMESLCNYLNDGVKIL